MTENILPKETVMLDKFASDLGLEMLYAGRGIITLTSISVDRPGLRLAGFFSYFDTQRIMLNIFTRSRPISGWKRSKNSLTAARSPASSLRAICPFCPSSWSAPAPRARPSSARAR